MPKEKVLDAVGLYDLEVRWSSENEHVQVGVLTHDGRSIAEVLAGGDVADGRRMGMVDPDAHPDVQPAGDPAGFTSLWATLDRRQINRLIWVLRRARDTAYGRDE